MKKINLTIPKPCHENWDQMTPEAKGRFCGSCQKTVVDFTNMSDRELANFFKKPMGSVCGRFQNDQLNREITVPKKSIPWLRHFIHIAWPAFILMLKSCNVKDQINSRSSSSLTLSDKQLDKKEEKFMTTGMVLTPIEVPEEMIPPPPPAGKVEAVTIAVDDYVKWGVADVDAKEPDRLMGDVVVTPMEPIDSAVGVQLIDEVDTAFVDMDTVTVVATSIVSCSRIIMGAVTSVRTENVSNNVASDIAANTADRVKPAVIAYPNPSRAGSILHLKFAEKGNTPVSIQLLTSGGQRVVHKMLGKGNLELPVMFQLPGNLASGIYFIQVLYANGSTDKVSVMVGL